MVFIKKDYNILVIQHLWTVKGDVLFVISAVKMNGICGVGPSILYI